MSWCTVEQIGPAATIRHVKITQQVWESYVGRFALYAPSGSWSVTRHLHESFTGLTWMASLDFRCISVSEIKLYMYARLLATISSVEVDGRFASFDKPAGVINTGMFGLQVTGVRGTAGLDDLAVDDELKAGQSVVRAGKVVLLEEDGMALADDQLIVVPEILNSAAITVARRVIQMEQDQQSAYDDSTYGGGGIGNRLVDGWIGPVQEFLK